MLLIAFLVSHKNYSQEPKINKSYAILNKHSAICLDIPRGSKSSGQNLVQWDYYAKNHNHWKFLKVDENYFRIQSLHSNLYLTASGSYVVQSRYNNSGFQLWKTKMIDSTWFILINKGSGRAMDLIEATTKSNAPIIQTKIYGGNTQQWRIYPAQDIPITQKIDKSIRTNLGDSINERYDENYPIITADGRRLFFTKEHKDPISGKVLKDVYISDKINNQWSKGIKIKGNINNQYNNAVCSVSPDGKLILLNTAYGSNGKSYKGLSYSRLINNRWTKPKNIKIKGYNNLGSHTTYFLCSDLKTLILSFKGPDTKGSRDLYVSFLEKDSVFSLPKNLGLSINTPLPEVCPYMSPDMKTLYFASSGHPTYGNLDIFVAKRLDDSWTNWSQPKNLGYGINSGAWEAYFSIPSNSNFAFICSTLDSKGKGDIFTIDLPDSLKPDNTIEVIGKVYNTKDNSPLGANIYYYNVETDEVAGHAYSDPQTGGYQILLPKGIDYYYVAEKDKFISSSAVVYNNQIKDSINIPLSKIELNSQITLNRVLFDYAQSNINNSINKGIDKEIERFAKWLKENPNIRIQIEGHTDQQGSSEYNQSLSLKRANKVKSLLVNKGISSYRITTKGYGESKLLDKRNTETAYQKNRRVVIRITKI